MKRPAERNSELKQPTGFSSSQKACAMNLITHSDLTKIMCSPRTHLIHCTSKAIEEIWSAAWQMLMGKGTKLTCPLTSVKQLHRDHQNSYLKSSGPHYFFFF